MFNEILKDSGLFYWITLISLMIGIILRLISNNSWIVLYALAVLIWSCNFIYVNLIINKKEVWQWKIKK